MKKLEIIAFVMMATGGVGCLICSIISILLMQKGVA